MNHLNARNKLLIALTTILLFSFAGVSFLNYKITRASIHAEIVRNDLPLTMDNIYSELTSELTRPLLVSSSMGSDTFLKDWAQEGEADPDKITRYLAEIKEKYDFFTTFFVSAKTGVYYRFSGIHKIVSPDDAHDVWYYDFLASGKEYTFDVDKDEAADNVLTVFINYKVLDGEGKLLGVTGVGLKVDTVAHCIADYRKKYDRVVYLTDTSGVIQVHPDTTIIEKKRIADMEGIAGHAESILKISTSSANFDFHRGGHQILLTVRYIESLDWFLYVEQNETDALAIARKNFTHTILIGLVVSVMILTLTLVTINRYQDRLEILAVSDELTGTANRRALEAEFQRILYAHSRSGRLFSLLLLDLDGFKKVNDTHGHIVGDNFLIDLVGLIGNGVRPADTFARWGGDEFVILTDSDGEAAVLLAERIRQLVRKNDFVERKEKHDDPRNLVTVSIGITVYAKGDNLDAMIYRADQAMYRCKARGGNCVELAA
ncbi:MAG: sensor domain-containing diguanylate cyclase [Desulforhopalus sp.]